MAMPSSAQSNVAPFTKGACLDFNNSTCFWNPCRYNHVCSNSGGQNHGRLNCFKLQGSALAGKPWWVFLSSIQRISHHLSWGTTFLETWQQTVESNQLMLEPRSRNLFTLSRTPINLENLKLKLMDYDSAKATEILNGFTYGFPLNYTQCMGTY